MVLQHMYHQTPQRGEQLCQLAQVKEAFITPTFRIHLAGSSNNSVSDAGTTTDNASASSASSVSEQDSSSESVSFTKIEGTSDQDAKKAISSSSLISGDFEYINPKDMPVPTVYGPPVTDR